MAGHDSIPDVDSISFPKLKFLLKEKKKGLLAEFSFKEIKGTFCYDTVL